MKLTFLGTRGNIAMRSRLHRMHSVLMVSSRNGHLLVDFGKDWLGQLGHLHPTAVVLSHAHEDHAAGLEQGAPCAVYATARTWRALPKWPLAIKCVVPERRALMVAGLRLEAWPVEHSLIAPAVGFRIADRSTRIFYVPDVARLRDPIAALRDIDIYIGDGATLTRSLVRSRGSVHIGHATMPTQLEWCVNAGVRRAIFTHCGSAIVRSDPKHLAQTLRTLSREYGIATQIAHDGMTMLV